MIVKLFKNFATLFLLVILASHVFLTSTFSHALPLDQNSDHNVMLTSSNYDIVAPPNQSSDKTSATQVSDNSVNLLLSILKDPRKRDELIKQLENINSNNSNSTNVYPLIRTESLSLEGLKEFRSLFGVVAKALKTVVQIDVLFMDTYHNLKVYSQNLVAAVLGIPTAIHKFINSTYYIDLMSYLALITLIILVFMFVCYLVEQNISTYFISRYPQKIRGNKLLDKLIYIGIVLLTSFLPVVGSTIVVVLLSFMCFLILSVFFTTNIIFMAVIVKFAVIWVVFRTILIFIRKMLLVSVVLNVWGYLNTSYKEVRELYIWIRIFLSLLFTFVITNLVITNDNVIIVNLQLAVIKIFFIIFSILLFIFLYRFKAKIQKGLTAFATNTQYFYVKRLFHFLSKRFYILALIYVLIVLSSFILGKYSSLFHFLNATLFTIILIIIHHFLQYYGAKYIKRFFSYRFIDLVDTIYSDDKNKRNLYANVLGNPKLELLLEGVYYYAFFFIFCLGILQIWGINVLNVIKYVYSLPIIQPITQIIMSFVIILLLTVLILLFLRRRILYLTKTKNFEDINKTLSLLLLFKNIYILVCIIVMLVVALKVFGVSVTTLMASTGIVALLVAFGAKDLMRNFFNALLCILHNTLSVGDVVTIGNSTGVVEDITAAYVRVRDLEGRLHAIPFSDINRVINETKGYSYAATTIKIDANSDLKKTLSLLNEISESLLADYSNNIIEGLEVTATYNLAAGCVDLLCKIKTYPGKQYEIKREFLKRVKELFNKTATETIFKTPGVIQYLIQ